MNTEPANSSEGTIAMLRRLKRPQALEERCDFCNVAIPPEHRHLLETEKKQVICVCSPCALRFENVVGGRFKLIPRDAQALRDFQMSDAQWEELALPINLVFVYNDSRAKKMMAMYPSPAGATESLLQGRNWEALVAGNEALAGMKADVEALLINRIGAAREYYIAPIDVGYELAGLIRMHWRGLSGGEKVWEEIEKFFAKLRGQTGTVAGDAVEVAHA